MNLFLLIIGLLPSFMQKPLRRLLGANLHSKAKISMFSIVLVKKLTMSEEASIGPFVYLKSEEASLGKRAKIRPLCMIKVMRFILGDDSSLDPLVMIKSNFEPKSHLTVGKFTRIFSFSILEPSEGITLGDHVGIGGQCLIFCHGSWPNYLNGAPFSRGPVVIEDEVWLPWRVMILPNSTIQKRAIIGAHSLVRGNVSAQSLYSGVPAKLVSENAWVPVNEQMQETRLQEILADFNQTQTDPKNAIQLVRLDKVGSTSNNSTSTVFYSFNSASKAQDHKHVSIDFKNLEFQGSDKTGLSFVRFLAGYGVRLKPFTVLAP